MNKKRVAERLVYLRGAQKQEVVATAVGISRSALAMYESGKRVPRDEIKVRLAKYYHTSVQAVFFDAE